MTRTRTLWSARTREQYFLLPDDLPMVAAMTDAPPPPGMFELGTITGRRRFVREEDVQAYEVSRDEATEWLLVELDPEIQALKDAAIERAERLLEEAELLQAEQERQRQRSLSKTRI